MKVDNKLVDKIAELARLEFEDKAKEEIIKDMNNMLSFVEQLNAVDTTGVEPLIYMTNDTNILREDVAKVSVTQEQALKNAPKHDSDYFKVPKVISK